MAASRARVVVLLTDAAGIWSSGRALQHAGALAFCTLFSMAPLLIVLIAIVGAVFGAEAARGEISAQISDLIGPQAAGIVEGAVRRSRVDEAGLLPSALGVAALLFGSTTVFAQMQSSLNQFWGVEARPSRSGMRVFITARLASFGLVLVIGFLLLTSLVVSTGISALIRFADDWVPIPPAIVTVVDVLVSVTVAAVLFAMIFKILPDVRLRWHDVWQGAIVTALLFVGGKVLIALYLTHTATASTYGAAGSLVIVLMWVYYSSLILFFGAALTQAAIRLRGDRIMPKPTAVKVRTEIVEELDVGTPGERETQSSPAPPAQPFEHRGPG